MLYLLCQTLPVFSPAPVLPRAPPPCSLCPPPAACSFFLNMYINIYFGPTADCRLPTADLAAVSDLPRPATPRSPSVAPTSAPFLQRAFEMLKVISSTIVDSRAASAASWQALLSHLLSLAGCCCCCALNYATHFASSLRACPSCVKVMECHKAAPCQEVA